MPAAALEIDISGLLAGLERVDAEVEQVVDEEIDRAFDDMIKWIRANDSTLFDDPSGVLTGGLYRTDAAGGSAEAGWSGPAAVYGPILEWGPRVREWEIAPRGLRSDNAPVRALRWVDTAGVHYARRVLHRWDVSQLRPHWRPAIERARDPFRRRLAKRIRQMVSNHGCLHHNQ